MTIEDHKSQKSRAETPRVGLTDAERDKQWICDWCGQHYVVPMLARACEDKHLE